MGISGDGWIAILVIVAFFFLLVVFHRKLCLIPCPCPREEDGDIELGSNRVDSSHGFRFPSFVPAINSGQAVTSASGHVGPVTHSVGDGQGGGGQVN